MDQETLLTGLALQAMWLVPAGLLGGAVAAALGQPRLVGGLLMGLVLSPAVLGHLAPHVDTHLRHANAAEQVELETYAAKRNDMRLKLLSTGITEVAVELFDEVTEEQVAKLQQAADDTAARQRDARRVAVLLAGGLLVLLGGFLLNERKWAAFVPDALGVSGGSLIGVAALLAPAAWLLGRWPTDQAGLLATLGWLAAATVAALPIHLARRVDDDAGDVHHAAGVLLYALAWVGVATLLGYANGASWPWVAPVFAAAVLVVGRPVAGGLASMTQPGATRDAIVLVFIVVVTAGGVGVLQQAALPMLAIAALAFGVTTTRNGEHDSPARRLVDLVAPVVGVMIAAQIDYAAHFSGWLLVACVIVAADGKSIGGAVGARLAANRPTGVAMHIGAMLSTGGAVALVVAWLLHDQQVIDSTLLGAIVAAELILLLACRPVVAMARSLDTAPDESVV